MYLSLILAGFCVLFFLLQSLIQGFTEQFALISVQALVRPWTLITSIFLHGDLPHLLYNMLALALFGVVLETIIGKKRFLVLFFGAGILSSLSSAFLYREVVGASGAIFGILGALVLLRPRMQVWVYSLPMPMIVAAFVWGVGDIIGLFLPTGIANLGHLAGLATGLISGVFLRKMFGLRPRRDSPFFLSEKEVETWEDEWMK